ncbi:MAG: hypothetical protein LN364_02970, partial [Candidatus Thermoplasmatota archaeon]|nr:hypothetical protein [Candidatus Thermoplasmatota archaeon]
PYCGSPEVHSKYTCPQCNSYNVENIELIEHKKCGYIGPKETFMKNSSTVCPQCQTELHDKSGIKSEHTNLVYVKTFKKKKKKNYYKKIGVSYDCEKCGFHFDKPKITHLCQNCQEPFTYHSAKYEKVFTYKIVDTIVKELGGDLPILEDIKAILINKGFKFTLHPQITGASGVKHSFDFIAENNGIQLVFDLSVTGSKNDMMALLGKKVDVNPTKALLLDLSILDELSQLEAVYGIPVFKTIDKNFKTDFENYLATLTLPEKPQKKKRWFERGILK